MVFSSVTRTTPNDGRAPRCHCVRTDRFLLPGAPNSDAMLSADSFRVLGRLTGEDAKIGHSPSIREWRFWRGLPVFSPLAALTFTTPSSTAYEPSTARPLNTVVICFQRIGFSTLIKVIEAAPGVHPARARLWEIGDIVDVLETWETAHHGE